MGQWKVEKNYANSITSEGKQVTIEYATPADIEPLMNMLIDTINQWDTHTITVENAHLSYAKIHLAFIHTHPFADGNGRLARLIANLPLLQAGLPPLVIKQSNCREYIILLADYQTAISTPQFDKHSEHQFWPNIGLLNPFNDFCENSYRATLEALE